MDPVPATEDWRAQMKEELARHHDRTFECPVCGLLWAEPIIPGNKITCPGGCPPKMVAYDKCNYRKNLDLSKVFHSET